tara:strand:+ start:619 stop:750 length:132 start_codon:yes stop_codon:yes gene_type:complete
MVHPLQDVNAAMNLIKEEVLSDLYDSLLKENNPHTLNIVTNIR